MPVPCKNPRYRYKGKVRLTWCGNRVVEAKTKKHIALERAYKRRIHRGTSGGYYYVSKGKKVYV